MKAKRRTLGVLLFLILLAGGVFALLTLRNAREEQAASAAADGTIPLAAVSGNDLKGQASCRTVIGGIFLIRFCRNA